MQVQNNLKKFRFSSDQMTQDQLAKCLDVSRQTIIAIEKGKFNPSVKLALKMAKLFKCNVENLFYLNKEE